MFVDDLKSFQKVKSESLISPKKIKNEPEAAEPPPVQLDAKLKSEPVVKEEPQGLKPVKGAAKRAGTDSAPNTPTKIKPSKSKRRKQ